MVSRSGSALDSVWSDERGRQVLVGVGQGDRAAFATLFGHFAPKVKAFLIRKGCDAVEAEEITQEAFVAVWRKAYLYDPRRSSAATWIFSIARNQYIDAYRRNRRHTLITSDPADEAPASLSPEDALLTVEDEAEVRSALTRLSAEQLTVIKASFFEDKTHAGIAEEFNIPMGTVKSRIRLAISHLRKLMDERR